MSLSQSSPQSIPVLLYKVEATDVFPLIGNFFRHIHDCDLFHQALPFLPARKQRDAQSTVLCKNYEFHR